MKNRSKIYLLSTVALSVNIGSAAVVQWETNGTTGGTANETATLTNGSKTVTATISVPLIDINNVAGDEQGHFVTGSTAEDSGIIRGNEDSAGRYNIEFSSPVGSLVMAIGNLGRSAAGTLLGGIAGNFVITTGDGSVFYDAPFTLVSNPLDPADTTFSLFSSDTELAQTINIDYNGDLVNEHYIHDATSNGGGQQAGAFVEFNTNFDALGGVKNVSFDQIGDGVGPTITFAVFAEVPEPSSAALLGLGGLALILRRRK